MGCRRSTLLLDKRLDPLIDPTRSAVTRRVEISAGQHGNATTTFEVVTNTLDSPGFDTGPRDARSRLNHPPWSHPTSAHTGLDSRPTSDGNHPP
nr:hypothetical protein ISGA_13255 [Gordonia sp. NB41Y]